MVAQGYQLQNSVVLIAGLGTFFVASFIPSFSSEVNLSHLPSSYRSKLILENLEDSCVLTGPDDSLEDKHGCPAYVGPEILSSKSSYSGKAADMWSLGVALYTLLVGCYPFQDTKPASLFGKIRRGRFAVPEDLSPKARCLIRCLLRKDPAERLTASGILLHPWLAAGSISEGSWSGPFGDQGLEQMVPEVGNWRDVEVEEQEEDGMYS